MQFGGTIHKNLNKNLTEEEKRQNYTHQIGNVKYYDKKISLYKFSTKEIPEG